MKKFAFSSLILITVLFCGLESCKEKSSCDQGVKGVFKDFTGLDGCGWIIELEDKSVIEPSNLQDFMIIPRENKKIWVTYENAPLASICMVGQVVLVKCISER